MMYAQHSCFYNQVKKHFQNLQQKHNWMQQKRHMSHALEVRLYVLMPACLREAGCASRCIETSDGLILHDFLTGMAPQLGRNMWSHYVLLHMRSTHSQTRTFTQLRFVLLQVLSCSKTMRPINENPAAKCSFNLNKCR